MQNDETETITAKDFQRNIGSWVDVAHRGGTVHVQNHGRPYVTLIGTREYEQLLRDATKARLYGGWVPGGEIERRVQAALDKALDAAAARLMARAEDHMPAQSALYHATAHLDHPSGIIGGEGAIGRRIVASLKQEEESDERGKDDQGR